MKITGERPVDGVTPDGPVALHTAGYLENPYHVHLFDGTAAAKADFAGRRAGAQRLSRFVGLRCRVPHSLYVAANGMATRLFYRVQARRHAGGTTKISPAGFTTTEDVDPTTLSLFAVARRPRAAAVAG